MQPNENAFHLEPIKKQFKAPCFISSLTSATDLQLILSPSRPSQQQDQHKSNAINLQTSSRASQQDNTILQGKQRTIRSDEKQNSRYYIFHGQNNLRIKWQNENRIDCDPFLFVFVDFSPSKYFWWEVVVSDPLNATTEDGCENKVADYGRGIQYNTNVLRKILCILSHISTKVCYWCFSGLGKKRLSSERSELWESGRRSWGGKKGWTELWIWKEKVGKRRQSGKLILGKAVLETDIAAAGCRHLT